MEERLPFTDEHLEQEEYEEDCDRLAELEVQDCFSSWGRWFIEDGMLATWVCSPPMAKLVMGKMFKYERSIEDLRSKDNQQEFYDLMLEKSWMGEKGLKDLKRAFRYLSKNKVKGVD